MNNKKICIMTSVHRHDDVRIYHKEAKTFADNGFDVTIICSDFEGRDENGIKFKKVKVPSSRFLRMIKAPLLYAKAAKNINADYCHFHDPELIFAGLLLKNKMKVIYDSHEDFPRQVLTKPYLKPFWARLFSKITEKYETYAAKRFYSIVAAEPVIYDRFIKINKNTVMVCNYPKLEEFENIDIDFEKRKNKICYIGGITKIRGIFEMIDAVKDTDVKLVLAGDYETNILKTEAESKKGYQNVEYKGFLDRNGVKEVLSEVKAGLVTLHPVPKYLTALPVKMFEYMIAKVPVIASNFPYWEKIVNESGCGLCVDPTNPDEIKSAILYITKNSDVAEEMGENGRKTVLEKYNWEVEKEKLLALYNKDSVEV